MYSAENTETERERVVARQRVFFDALAENWRSTSTVDAAKFEALFADVPFMAGQRVLDVGCGTGVLEKFLAAKGLWVDAIDLSEKMIARAVSYGVPKGVRYAVADFYTFAGTDYDHVVVFDAYPHFTDKKAFARQAAAVLRGGGRLTVLFDESREKINGYHRDGDGVSVALLPAADEAAVFAERFDLLRAVDDERGYCLDLVKKQ